MLHHLGGALEHAHLSHSGDVAAVPLHAEFEVLVGIETRRVHAELCHVSASSCVRPEVVRGSDSRARQAWICPAICWSLMITNSAGLSGAKPTRMFTMPWLMSFCVVVSLSNLTKYASRGVWPWKAP